MNQRVRFLVGERPTAGKFTNITIAAISLCKTNGKRPPKIPIKTHTENPCADTLAILLHRRSIRVFEKRRAVGLAVGFA